MIPIIEKGDWVLVCETNDKGFVIEVFDDGERFLINVPPSPDWPHPKRMHVMIEKLRKIRPPKEEKPEIRWDQPQLF